MKKIIYIFSVFLVIFLMSFTASADDASEEITVKYFVGENIVTDRPYKSGEIISPPNVACDSGYTITGWRTSSGEIYDFTQPQNESISLYADVVLLPALAKIEGLSLTYDGESHILRPSSVYHPLEKSGGYYTFSWYKDGALIENEDSLKVKNVSDSGEYSLKIDFHINGEESVILYEGLSVEITPKSVAVPIIEPSYYTGALVTPSVPDSPLYSFDSIFVGNVGDYFLKLSLNDSENYRWEGTNDSEVFVAFKVIAPEAALPDGGDAAPDFDNAQSFGAILFLLSLLFASGALVMMIIARKNTNAASPYAQKTAKTQNYKISEPDDEIFDEPEFSIQLCENEKEHSPLDSISASRANLLISDSMAKNLIQKSEEMLIVIGNKRAEVSVGDISAAFREHETVNIDTLVERGLIDDDVGYLTVSEDGSVDKPLKIYANDFTLAAVKMIALSGGEVFKCHTKRY